MSRHALPLLLLSACSAATPTDLTWTGDVAPVVDQHCARCHDGSGLGPGDLTDPAVAELLAERMLARMEDGTMPPPVADPDCNPYAGDDHLGKVPEPDIDIFREWLDGGMPMGDSTQTTAGPPVSPELEVYDLEVQLPTYTPVFDDPENPNNEYRCFIIDHGRDEPFYITALHPQIDNAAIMHHMILSKVTMDELPEGYDPAVGDDCIDGRSDLFDGVNPLTDGYITGWAPGMLPTILDEGEVVRGMRVAPNQRFVLQVHYFQPGPDAAGTSDSSTFRFRTADEVDTLLRFVDVGWDDDTQDGEPIIALPPKQVSTVSGEFEVTEEEEGWIHGHFPHMHYLGETYRMSIEYADGTEQCVASGDSWDFDNQLSYLLDDPIAVPGGSKIKLECSFNNTTDEVVYGGERTNEEMCFVFIQAEVLPYGVADDAR